MHQSTSITSLRSLSLFVWCQHDLTPIVNVNIATRDLTLGTWQNNYRPKCNFTKVHTFEIVSGRLLGLLSTCECKISKTSKMAAANRSRIFLQEKWQENVCRLLLKWMHSQLQMSQLWYCFLIYKRAKSVMILTKVVWYVALFHYQFSIRYLFSLIWLLVPFKFVLDQEDDTRGFKFNNNSFQQMIGCC